MSIEDRFWSKVDIGEPDECWEWLGGTTPKGYGRFWLGRRSISATHYAIGEPVPDGMYVCHKCDNPKCVNPNHLFLGTPKENQQDMWNKGRGVTKRTVRKNYVRGENVHCSKLTKGDVIKMRSLYRPRKFGAKKLADMFGVSKHAVQDVLRKNTWRHI